MMDLDDPANHIDEMKEDQLFGVMFATWMISQNCYWPLNEDDGADPMEGDYSDNDFDEELIDLYDVWSFTYSKGRIFSVHRLYWVS